MLCSSRMEIAGMRGVSDLKQHRSAGQLALYKFDTTCCLCFCQRCSRYMSTSAYWQKDDSGMSSLVCHMLACSTSKMSAINSINTGPKAPTFPHCILREVLLHCTSHQCRSDRRRVMSNHGCCCCDSSGTHPTAELSPPEL